MKVKPLQLWIYFEATHLASMKTVFYVIVTHIDYIKWNDYYQNVIKMLRYIIQQRLSSKDDEHKTKFYELENKKLCWTINFYSVWPAIQFVPLDRKKDHSCRDNHSLYKLMTFVHFSSCVRNVNFNLYKLYLITYRSWHEHPW